MHIELISLAMADAADHRVPQGPAIAPNAQSQLWIELRFKPARNEGYDRVPLLLNVAGNIYIIVFKYNIVSSACVRRSQSM